MKRRPLPKPAPIKDLPRGVEGNITLLLAVSLMAVYFVGEQGILGDHLANAEGFREPLGAGAPVIAAVLGIILLNALFVAAETAVEQLRTLHVKHLKEASEARAARLQALVDDKAKYVAACFLGSQTMRLILIFLGFVLAQGLALALDGVWAWPFSFGTILLCALILAIPIGLINLVVGELVPKSYATLHPHLVALRLFRFVQVASIVFFIPARMVVGVANLLTARFGGRASFGFENQTEEEIKILVDSAQETGEIEVDEQELLHSVFEFTDTVAREVMTPRVDLDAMPIRSDPSDVVRLIAETGHSRIPLYEETDDQIVGIIHAKDLLMAMVQAQGKGVSLRKLMRAPLFVPENKNLHELLTEMRQGRSQLAIVQDEFGGTAGIVTIEDIVEELVGDIVDEYDVEEPTFVQTDHGFYVDGKAHVDDVNHELGSDFSSERFDTIGGFVFGLFGRQPKVDETIETDGYRFTVASTDGRRVHRLRIEPIPIAAKAD